MVANKVVSIMVTLFVVGALMGSLISSISDTSSNFTGATYALWLLLPLFIVLMIFYYVYNQINMKRKK